MSSTLIAKRRADYRAPDFSIPSINLCFELSPEKTVVSNTMKVTRNHSGASKLFLDGEDIDLLSLHINGVKASEDKEYRCLNDGIEIDFSQTAAFTNNAGESIELCIKNTINPAANTSLEGLYYVSGAYCTQCEAEGFRKITYFADRPDILSIYTVSIISDDDKLSFLLSNGNKVEDTKLDDGRRKVVWHDPYYKPSYLFALVAGDFDCLEDEYTTSEARKVSLQIFVDKGRLHQARHAMDSLKKAMRWDEERFGLAYDLDIYMIVAVDFFNMGAMENKGLNVFNSKFVLAEPETATDEDYFNIESIIAHEYFHNWTGNRVTCRDWFQLSLKEGLTVFRDQKFSEDMSSELGCRIKQVKVIKEHQFAEDAGPMSHPIRPDEVIEMNNFYTVTVYDKGAEVIRMLHTLLTPEGFRKGMDLYFERHDGQAVTCDDFVQAMQDANEHDLSHFKRWYAQSGTPVIDIQKLDDAFAFTQINEATADQSEKETLYIPVNFSILDKDGHEHFAPEAKEGTFVLENETAKATIPEAIDSAVPVILSNFSAPVKVRYHYTKDELIHIVQHASSYYAKWDASQLLYSMLIADRYQRLGASFSKDPSIATQAGVKASATINKLVAVFSELEVPKDVFAQLLSLPSIETLSNDYVNLRPLALLEARDHIMKELAVAAYELCLSQFESLKHSFNEPYVYEQEQVNARSLRAACMQLLSCYAELSSTHFDLQSVYQQANNMTDKLNALKAAQQFDIAQFDALISRFETDYRHDSVVMDKWFALHAGAKRADILARLDLLRAHSSYSIKNPNKVRALIGSFAFYNTQGFHAADESGYKYLSNYLIELDKINPQVASRLITPMLQLKRYEASHQRMIRMQLERLITSKGLSKDLFEKLSKTLTQFEAQEPAQE
uniref:aminopeptidase N n=1 Tax=Ningiella ruwaisensis TaxID=2364274 RepID=UPI00109FD244|nr:aminopeptidase N [Ningiella ruwaisensis]